MIYSIIAICVGASGGALLRWYFALTLNNLIPFLPLGTLGVNLIGGYGIGVAITLLNQNAHLAPEWRLLIVTGFLGGFTTFSAFSAEAVSLLQDHRYVIALVHVSAHVTGSLLMTCAGIATVEYLKQL